MGPGLSARQNLCNSAKIVALQQFTHLLHKAPETQRSQESSNYAGMPTIFQLPPLSEDRLQEPSSGAPRNGIPASAAVPSDDFRLHKNPFSLLEMELNTEGERLRRRESLWISLVVHAVVILLLIFALPKLLASRPVQNSAFAQMLQDHNLTFLELPPTSKPEAPKDTDKISDQNRVARSRRPVLDEKTLKQLQDSARAGAPGKMQAPAPKPVPSQRSQASPAQAQTPPGQPTQNPQNNNPAVNNQLAQLNAPAKNPTPAARGAFGGPVSANSAMEQATRAAAAGHKTYSGSSGDYGVGPTQQQTKLRSDYDVLSDTLGVDFGPYLARVLHDIRENWFNLIPEEARAPLMKTGQVSIEFAIQKDGKIAGLKMDGPSGDIALDRAAWGGITASNPFQPLPSEFRGSNLALRLRFFYNPTRSDLR